MKNNNLINIFFNKMNNNKISLGRWSIENNNKTGLKVHYANEDHCGTCADYIISKQNKTIK